MRKHHENAGSRKGQTTLPGTDLHAFLQTNHIFDHDHYNSCYKEEPGVTNDALAHFARTGIFRGLKPNKLFDPLIYRIIYPDCSYIDMLKNFMRHDKAELSKCEIQNVLREVEKTSTFLPTKSFDIDLNISNKESIRCSKHLSKPKDIQFYVDGMPFNINVPSTTVILDRLAADRPFAFTRLSHGDWDDLYVFQRYRGRVARAVASFGFDDEHIDRLTMRLCDKFYPDGHIFAENFLCEILHNLRTHLPDKAFMIAVGFKGYPTADENLFERTIRLKPVDIARLRIFANYFSEGEKLYDVNIFKRWAISGVLSKLPALLRDRPVILMGAERVAGLGKRWKLPWFLHIRIPPANSYPLRHGILHEAFEKISEAKRIVREHETKQPVFIFQGSSFAFWMINRLFSQHRDIFYLDMGQALHIWFYDVKEIPKMRWDRLYSQEIIKNNKLEEYYRNLESKTS